VRGKSKETGDWHLETERTDKVNFLLLI
jgi:hypothetical protein